MVIQSLLVNTMSRVTVEVLTSDCDDVDVDVAGFPQLFPPQCTQRPSPNLAKSTNLVSPQLSAFAGLQSVQSWALKFAAPQVSFKTIKTRK